MRVEIRSGLPESQTHPETFRSRKRITVFEAETDYSETG
jgi:hypothetical protein